MRQEGEAHGRTDDGYHRGNLQPHAFTLEDAEDMVEDQIRMDKEAGREPLAYDPQFFYDTIVELMEQDAE